MNERLRQVLFAKRVPVKQEVKPPVAVWLEQTRYLRVPWRRTSLPHIP